MDRRRCSCSPLFPRSTRVFTILFVQHDSCPLCRHTLVERDQGRQDDENSSERLPPDTDGSNAMHAYIEGLRARVASVDEILAFGLHDPDLPRQRENTDRGAEYSGMYS